MASKSDMQLTLGHKYIYYTFCKKSSSSQFYIQSVLVKRSPISKLSPSSSTYPRNLNTPTLYFYRISYSILTHTSTSFVFPSNIHIAPSRLPNAPVLPSLFTNYHWHKNYFQEMKRRKVLGEKQKGKRLKQDNCMF